MRVLHLMAEKGYEVLLSRLPHKLDWSCSFLAGESRGRQVWWHEHMNIEIAVLRAAIKATEREA